MRIDAIFDNARIHTMDSAHPIARRMGVHRGRIIGFDDDLDGVSAGESFDLRGAPVLPGFNDAHHHLSLTGARLASLDLRPGVVDTLDQLYAAVARRAAELPKGAWLRGSGYDQNILGAHPTAVTLDRVAGGRPVLLEHISAHMIVANTAAFELAGFSGRQGVPDFEGGTVARDPDQSASGLLQERAMNFIYALVRPMNLEQLQHNLTLANDHAVRYGLTSITEPGLGAFEPMGNSPVDLHSYQEALSRNTVRPRMTVMPYCTVLHDVDGVEDRSWWGLDLGIRTGLGDDRLRIGPVKIVADGSFIGRSARMHHCYHGEPENRGVMQFDPSELNRMVVGAHDAGWTVAAHAIGDEAIDHVIDAFAVAQSKNPRPDVRHRIEHFALASDAQVARAAALNLIAVPQGVFISEFGDAMMDAVEADRVPLIYRMKSLLEAGMVLPGSTDSPIAHANPLLSIHDMVNRRTASGRILGANERLTVYEAVRAYTYGSSYAVGSESDVGELRIGQLADFTVLSDNIFDVPEPAIRDLQIGATVIGGDVVYDDGAMRH